MPRWGLSRTQRHCQPWGITADWLAPAKTVTDVVHGDIYLTVLERELIDSEPMQRLRRVRQLGTAHLVYPSATHSRFSHALGTLRAAQDLMDAVIAGLSGPRVASNHLLEEWRSAGPHLTSDPSDPVQIFDMRIAEATVLARLGGLLHDLCHVPVGHTIEDDLGVLQPHDGNVERYQKLWSSIPLELRNAIGPQLTRELRALILSKEKLEEGAAKFESKYPFVTDIVGNTICADLIDYIRRDHKATGLPLALGNRFMNDFYVTPSGAVHWPQHMVVRVSRNGVLRPDVITELMKYLRYRYELSERVLYHHAKTAADAMIGKLLEMWRDALWVETVERIWPGVIDTPAIASDVSAVHSRVHVVHGADGVAQIDADVQQQLETQFLRWSDDGLLEYLSMTARDTAEKGGPGARRQRGIAQLSHMVLNRHIFKSLGRAGSDADLAVAHSTHKLFGGPARRRELEESAARFAGVTPRWQVVLWVPNPNMRMKIAEVLVDLDGRVAPLADMRSISGEANAIVEKHRGLWGVGVYGHASLNSWQRRAVLAWMRDHMGLAFVDEHGQPAPTVTELIAGTLIDELSVTGLQRNEIFALVENSAMEGEPSFLGRLHQVDALRIGAKIAPETQFPFDTFTI